MFAGDAEIGGRRNCFTQPDIAKTAVCADHKCMLPNAAKRQHLLSKPLFYPLLPRPQLSSDPTFPGQLHKGSYDIGIKLTHSGSLGRCGAVLVPRNDYH